MISSYSPALTSPDLETDLFYFLVDNFSLIPHVEIIFKQLQTESSDPIKYKTWTHWRFVAEFLPRKNCLLDCSASNNKKGEALKVCDGIIEKTRIKISFSGHLRATNLFEVEKFSCSWIHFPEDLLSENNDPFSEKNRLKTELMILYEREKLQVASGAISFLALASQDIKIAVNFNYYSYVCVRVRATLFSVEKTFLRNYERRESECCQPKNRSLTILKILTSE